jgi:hypothetical protein
MVYTMLYIIIYTIKRRVVYTSIYTMKQSKVYTIRYTIVCTQVYTMGYIYGLYHDIYYHIPILYIPWHIPKVLYTTFRVVYTMRQPSRWSIASGSFTT